MLELTNSTTNPQMRKDRYAEWCEIHNAAPGNYCPCHAKKNVRKPIDKKWLIVGLVTGGVLM